MKNKTKSALCKFLFVGLAFFVVACQQSLQSAPNGSLETHADKTLENQSRGLALDLNDEETPSRIHYECANYGREKYSFKLDEFNANEINAVGKRVWLSFYFDASGEAIYAPFDGYPEVTGLKKDHYGAIYEVTFSFSKTTEPKELTFSFGDSQYGGYTNSFKYQGQIFKSVCIRWKYIAKKDE